MRYTNKIYALILIVSSFVHCLSQGAVKEERYLVKIGRERTKEISGLLFKLKKFKASKHFANRHKREGKCFVLRTYKGAIEREALFCYDWQLIHLNYYNMKSAGATIRSTNCRFGCYTKDFKNFSDLPYTSFSMNGFFYEKKFDESGKLRCFKYRKQDSYKVRYDKSREISLSSCKPPKELIDWYRLVLDYTRKQGFKAGDSRLFGHPDFAKFIKLYEMGTK